MKAPKQRSSEGETVPAAPFLGSRVHESVHMPFLFSRAVGVEFPSSANARVLRLRASETKQPKPSAWNKHQVHLVNLGSDSRKHL